MAIHTMNCEAVMVQYTLESGRSALDFLGMGKFAPNSGNLVSAPLRAYDLPQIMG